MLYTGNFIIVIVIKYGKNVDKMWIYINISLWKYTKKWGHGTDKM
jgi:hypothetical protein